MGKSTVHPSQTSISIQAKDIRPGMIMNDCLINSVDYIDGKVRIYFTHSSYEDYSPLSWLSISRADNSGNREHYGKDEYRPERY